ncbi:serine/threonine protein kinase [Variovorax sp. KK3]|uniref:serine/threonine protein kinase n=1 Tax=Variovorax sp. KK3 TaxID=1855728 RepID=UPI00097CBAC5|nr:serine/threonine protein kinase [Variovorax sp. KK3]
MKRHSIAATALVGLMSLAGATYAQTTSTPAAPDPAKGGQASTKSVPGGVANATQRPDGSDPASRDAVRAEARAHNRNNMNNATPKGEATTTVNGQPNAMPRPTGEMTRTEVSMETRKQRPRFGNPGERPDVPTNPKDRTGTPQ